MNRLFELLAGFGTTRLIGMAAVAAGLIGFFLFISMRLSEPQMGLLFSDLEMSESGRIVEELQAQNISYRLTEGGRTILAPADRVNELRVMLAGQGLSGNVIGYELFDRSNGLGTTSFVQNINRVRAIEGELSRTIREIHAIEAARVHIVLPERALFSREEREPTASIVLRSRGTISQSQVGAIQSLVAAAVAGLSPGNISIVDQNGTLLARSGEGSLASGLTGSLDEKRRKLEEQYRGRIESLLEETVGIGRVRAQVAIDLDMSSVTTNEETYDPESQVARSTRTVEEANSDQDRMNDTVSVGNNLPQAENAAPAEGSRMSRSDKLDETINYEISRTVRTRTKESGDISRLTVAVVVDGTYSVGEDGTRVYQERSPQQIEQLASLVRSAVGYDANRGDMIEVVNLPFVLDEGPSVDVEQSFSFLGLGKRDLYDLLEMLLLGIVTLLVLLLVVRPLVNRLVLAIPEAGNQPAQPVLGSPDGHSSMAELEYAASQGDQTAIAALARPETQYGKALPASSPGSSIDVANIDNRLKESSVKKIGEIVKTHPEEATAIVRGWLYAD